MPPRILHIIDSLGRTGTATQLLALARGLLEQGWDVHVAALDGGGPLRADFQQLGIQIVDLRRRWVVDPIAFGRLHRAIVRLRPSVIHTWGRDVGFYGRLAAGSANVPRLVSGRYRADSWPMRWSSPDQSRWGRQPDQWVTDSEFLRRRCIQRGCPGGKLALIRPGVPLPRASDLSRTELLRELRLPADAKLIGVIGPLVPEKRVKDLIWAADLLRVLHDNLRLLVIGDGPLRAQLTQYARLASDLDHIQFLGDRDDVWRVMPHLDVLWNASENRSHSFAILEAMAVGVPVIASDTPLNREFVIENETGYLVPLHERSGRATRARHTDRIFTDGDLTNRLATAARRRALEHFNVERMLQQYVDLYAGVKCRGPCV